MRCLLLKQILRLSYQQLAFHLSDSPTFRSFARLSDSRAPGKSALQATIRTVRAETLHKINQQLMLHCIGEKLLTVSSVRIDSTPVQSNIATPRDSQLLADGIRVLSRLMASSVKRTGVKLRFVDQRKRSKSLAFQVFHSKKAQKYALYPKLLACAKVVAEQVERSVEKVNNEGRGCEKTQQWLTEVEHYRALTARVVDQTQRRVLLNENVEPADKILSLFEPHTDILSKGLRDVQYGHKINLATQSEGFITYLNIETGNPNDKTLYPPVLKASQKEYGQLPFETVADGGYASAENVASARAKGVNRVVFNKRCGLGFHAMGVKQKSFERLRDFRAGIEGNISELKRAFGMNKVSWKKQEGFNAYVWSCALSYNLMRMVRLGFT